MRTLAKLRPSPALVVALAALVLATGGAAVALPGKGSVKKKDIAKGAVTSRALANGAVKGRDIAKGAVKSRHVARGAIASRQIKGKSIRGNRLRDKTVKWKQIADKTITADQIADATITGAQVAANGLSSANISDLKAAATGIVQATAGPSRGAALAAAPAQRLFEKGQLTVYGKCSADQSSNEVHADVIVASSADGAILQSDGDSLLGNGGAFLGPNTPEGDRLLVASAAGAGSAAAAESDFMAISPDGTKLIGQAAGVAKNGNLPGGNGVYGPGDVCLFNAEIAG